MSRAQAALDAAAPYLAVNGWAAVLLAAIQLGEGAANEAGRRLGLLNDAGVGVLRRCRAKPVELLTVLDAAESEAAMWSQHYLGTEHLFLAAIRDQRVALCLSSLGVDLRIARGELWQVLLDLSPGGKWHTDGAVPAAMATACGQETLEITGDPAMGGAVDGLLRPLLSDELLVGLSVAVAKADGRGCVTTHGHVDVARPGRVNDRSWFALGSITKPLVAIGVLKLVSDGRLSLDTNVDDVVGGVRVVDHDGGPITIHELLTHSSGLAQGSGLRHYDDPPLAINDVVGSELRATYPKGSWQYSNLGYWLLGQAIEMLTGESWHDWLRSTLLVHLGIEPLGVLSRAEQPVGHVVSDNAVHRVRPSHIVAAPAGGLWSTARAISQLGNALGALHMFLGPRLADLLLTPALSTAVPGELQGIGFVVSERSGRVSHEGSWPGHSASFRHDPRTGTTAVALANTSTGRLARLTSDILDVVQDD